MPTGCRRGSPPSSARIGCRGRPRPRLPHGPGPEATPTDLGRPIGSGRPRSRFGVPAPLLTVLLRPPSAYFAVADGLPFRLPDSPDRYELVGVLGKGSFGTVYRARIRPPPDDESVGPGGRKWRPPPPEVAVKVVPPTAGSAAGLRGLLREIAVLSGLRHHHIVRYFGSFFVPRTRNLWIVMELCAGGSVADLLRRRRAEARLHGYAGGGSAPPGNTLLPESVLRLAVSEALQALCFIHGRGHLHRDLKCGNLLLTRGGAVKLADFGVATAIDADGGPGGDWGDPDRGGDLDPVGGFPHRRGAAGRTFTGTPHWMAPEVIVGSAKAAASLEDRSERGRGASALDASSQRYGPGVDVWGLGICCIEMAEGKPPRSGATAFAVLSQIAQGPPPTLRDPGKWSARMRSFVEQCLRRDPRERPPAGRLLRHRWLEGLVPVSALQAAEEGGELRVPPTLGPAAGSRSGTDDDEDDDNASLRDTPEAAEARRALAPLAARAARETEAEEARAGGLAPFELPEEARPPGVGGGEPGTQPPSWGEGGAPPPGSRRTSGYGGAEGGDDGQGGGAKAPAPRRSEWRRRGDAAPVPPAGARPKGAARPPRRGVSGSPLPSRPTPPLVSSGTVVIADDSNDGGAGYDDGPGATVIGGTVVALDPSAGGGGGGWPSPLTTPSAEPDGQRHPAPFRGPSDTPPTSGAGWAIDGSGSVVDGDGPGSVVDAAEDRVSPSANKRVDVAPAPIAPTTTDPRDADRLAGGRSAAAVLLGAGAGGGVRRGPAAVRTHHLPPGQVRGSGTEHGWGPLGAVRSEADATVASRSVGVARLHPELPSALAEVEGGVGGSGNGGYPGGSAAGATPPDGVSAISGSNAANGDDPPTPSLPHSRGRGGGGGAAEATPGDGRPRTAEQRGGGTRAKATPAAWATTWKP